VKDHLDCPLEYKGLKITDAFMQYEEFLDFLKKTVKTGVFKAAAAAIGKKGKEFLSFIDSLLIS
jgi:hypothetical protein